MYASKNFKTKKTFKAAVEAGERITLFSPGLGTPATDGRETVEGPHFPAPHTWYATVTIQGGVVIKVR